LVGCEIRLCAFVRPRVPCVPCVSRLPPVSFYRYFLFSVLECAVPPFGEGPTAHMRFYPADNEPAGSAGAHAHDLRHAAAAKRPKQ
jgi:hypothetical protein